MNISRVLSGFLALLSLATMGVHAEEVAVAVAANFMAPMKQIAAAFEKESGHTVVASFGSTGKFYAQIKNGAPFDVLLGADDETPPRLVSEGMAVAGTVFTYAVGKLVLWSPQPGLVDAAGRVLQRGGFAHLSLADPKLAPYGAAGVQTLKSLGVYDALKSKVVMAENIAQAYQFTSTGNAELGFVALSQVLRDGSIEGSWWLVPANLYPPIRQDAVLLERGRGRPAAQALMKYLQGETARAIVKSYGYALP